MSGSYNPYLPATPFPEPVLPLDAAMPQTQFDVVMADPMPLESTIKLELEDDIQRTSVELRRSARQLNPKKRKRPEEEPQPKKAAKKKKARALGPVFTHKENATNEQRVEILDWYHENGENQVRTANHFARIYPNLKLKQPLMSSWVKDEQMWRERWEKDKETGGREAKRIRSTRYPEIDKKLESWVEKAMEDKVLLTGEVLRQKWTLFADEECIPHDERLKLSAGWLTSFQGRCGLRQFKLHGEAASAKPEDVERERERIQELIRNYGYCLKDIFNVDETGLLYGMPPNRGLSDRPNPGMKGCKNRITYALTANADGSEKLPPFVIGRYAKPRAFGNQSGEQLGFQYRNNAKAWMTTPFYQEWVVNLDKKMREQGRHILLLQDNFSAHKAPKDHPLTNVHIENFKANLTAHVQPNDAGIIQCFKAHYRKSFAVRAINRYDRGVGPTSIYDIDQLEAMRLADRAWGEVDTTTIRNCWRKSGILPSNPLISYSPLPPPAIPISSLLNSSPYVGSGSGMSPEIQYIDALEKPEDVEVMEPIWNLNRIGIEESLVDPECEKELIGQVSEMETFEVVMNADAREKLRHSNGGDGADRTETPQVIHSHEEALAAATTIQRYIPDMDEAYTRNLESLLAGFGSQTRL